MPATFTLDGFTGAGVTLNANVFLNIAKFEIDCDKALLKMTDTSGKVTNVSCSDIATMTVTVSGFKITAVTIAN